MSHRILLVEDDPVAREVIASLLQSRGHTVDTAEEGFSALQMAQDTKYAVVFIDYHLPEMDGYALARLMRTLGEAADGSMKMVAITADQFGLAARRGVDAVFDSVLAKPIEPERLFAFIDHLLDEPSPLEAVESFLEPSPQAALSSRAALALWESRGLGRVPTARVFPSPTAAERANIEACFQISDGAPADCILLLRAAGLGAVETLRRHEASYLMPLVSLDPALASQADVVFEPGNGGSWSETSRVIKAFADRRALLRDDVVLSQAPEIRFAALLFAADRELELLRHASGHAVLSYTAGCEAALVIKAIKQLASQGIIATRLDRGDDDDAPRMFIALSARGLRQLQIDRRESRAN